MAKKKVCPTCGCTIVEGFYDQAGIEYCCEPCAKSQPCECGCCEVKAADPPKKASKAKK